MILAVLAAVLPRSVFQLLAYTLILLSIQVPVGAQGAGDAEIAYRLELVTACAEATDNLLMEYVEEDRATPDEMRSPSRRAW